MKNTLYEVIFMDMSKKEYAKYVTRHEPQSPHLKNFIKAYLFGGFICLMGQAFIRLYSYLGASRDDASTLASISLVLISALLTGFGLYDKIAKHAGAGTLVPITGFANSIVSESIEFKTEGYILGVGAKMFTLAGPVIVYGTAASVVYGFIYWLMS